MTLDDPRVKILDDLIQRGIRQEAQDQWQSLLDRSDRRTNPTRYWSLLRKLSGKRAPQPPNISISFGRSPLSSAKTIAKAFTKQFTAVAVPGGSRPDGGEQVQTGLGEGFSDISTGITRWIKTSVRSACGTLSGRSGRQVSRPRWDLTGSPWPI